MMATTGTGGRWRTFEYRSARAAGLLAALMGMFAGQCLAGPGADALAAGDTRRALSILEPQARRGQSDAQYLLGHMRELGTGVPVDQERARYWYGLAAAQKHPGARTAPLNDSET